MKLWGIQAAVFFLALLMLGCGATSTDPVVMVADDDSEMLAAEQEARDNLQQFLDALMQPKAQHIYSVKTRFKDGDQVEFMWLTDLKLVDGKLEGKVDNDPQLVKNVSIGDRVSISPSEINDWMIMMGDTMIGGYTVKVLMAKQGK